MGWWWYSLLFGPSTFGLFNNTNKSYPLKITFQGMAFATVFLGLRNIQGKLVNSSNTGLGELLTQVSKCSGKERKMRITELLEDGCRRMPSSVSRIIPLLYLTVKYFCISFLYSYMHSDYFHVIKLLSRN